MGEGVADGVEVGVDVGVDVSVGKGVRVAVGVCVGSVVDVEGTGVAVFVRVGDVGTVTTRVAVPSMAVAVGCLCKRGRPGPSSMMPARIASDTMPTPMPKANGSRQRCLRWGDSKGGTGTST